MSLSDKYCHLNPIGEGSFGVVKHYRKIADGSDVAIKFLKPTLLGDKDQRHRFRREIRLLEVLGTHQGIVDILESHESESEFYYVMPLADQNLNEYIRHNNQSLAIEGRFEMASQMIDAVEYAHSKKILHRDLAPSNVLVFGQNKPQLKLVDFGLGRQIDSASFHTTAGAANLGHFYYTAPEQRASLKDASVVSDIYSLGCMLDFIMTGREPSRVHDSAIVSICRRAMEEDPGKRYQSVQEMRHDFNAILDLEIGTGQNDILLTLTQLGNAKTTLSAHAVQKVVTGAVYSSHPYHGYLMPVCNYFSDQQRLADYCKNIGSDSLNFVDRFSKEIKSVSRMTGWPFSECGIFAQVLVGVFRNVDDVNVKSMCLVALWDLSIERDQWNAKKIFLELVTSSDISSVVAMPLARHIADNGTVVKDDESITASLPANIHRAISQARQKQERAG